jgi:hypothetical protein
MPKFSIPWKYCECGCKGSSVTIGGLYFTYFDDLHGGLWFSTQHHAHLTGVMVQSYAAITRRVRQALKAQKAVLAQQTAELEGL